MRYPPEETAKKHEKILNEAARLYRQNGFTGAGVAEIMKAAGLTHGAFYAHFNSKEDLAAEALTRAFEQSGKRMYKLTEGAEDQKTAFIDAYLREAHRDEPEMGCPLPTLAPEVARTPALRGPLTVSVKRMLDGMVDRFRWKTPGSERRKAIQVIAASVGAVILARAVDDPDLSDEILASMRDGLKEL